MSWGPNFISKGLLLSSPKWKEKEQHFLQTKKKKTRVIEVIIGHYNVNGLVCALGQPEISDQIPSLSLATTPNGSYYNKNNSTIYLGAKNHHISVVIRHLYNSNNLG